MNMCYDTKSYLKILFSIQWLLCQTAINTEGFCFKNSDFPKMSLGKVVLLLLASAYCGDSTVSTFFNLEYLEKFRYFLKLEHCAI